MEVKPLGSTCLKEAIFTLFAPFSLNFFKWQYAIKTAFLLTNISKQKDEQRKMQDRKHESKRLLPCLGMPRFGHPHHLPLRVIEGGNDFGQDNFAKFVTFVISSGLLGTVYYLFQSVLAEVSLRLLQVSVWYWQHRDRRARQGWLSLPFWVVCMFKNQRNSKMYSRFRWFLSKENAWV